MAVGTAGGGTMMSRLRWTAAHFGSAGPPGWLAAAIAIGSLAVWLAIVRPMQAETARVEQDNASLARRAAPSTKPLPQPPTPREQLDEFSRRFMTERAVPSSLARLVALARRQGLLLEQGEFRWSSDTSEPLARYTAVLPVKGSYRAVRRFSQDAVQATPGLAIEEIQLRRGDPRSRTVDAQLKLVLFVARS